ncbi:MAG TPA: DUF2142 domain-containing protein [bacterium]|nr:DUF2142 domain-containing protein [bacterium]
MLGFFGKAENLFLLIGLIFGLAFSVTIPPFQVMDEEAHFYRAYQLGQGQLWPERSGNSLGGELPKSLPFLRQPFERLGFHAERKTSLQELRWAWTVPLDRKDRAFVAFPTTARYPPLPYLGGAVAAALGELGEMRPMAILHLGRLLHLLLWIAVIYAALRLTPVYRWLFFALALLPSSVYLASGVSADGLSNGLCFLFSACLFRWAFGLEDRIGRRQWLIFTALALLLAAAKPAYVLLVLAFLMIAPRKYANREWPWLFALSAISAIGCQLLWLGIEGRMAVTLRGEATMSYAIQKQFVLEHPLVFLRLVIDSFLDYGSGVLGGFVGRFGWTEYGVPSWMLVAIPLGLIAIALGDGDEVEIGAGPKIVAALITAGLFLVLCLSQFLTWTPVGIPIIQGLQGRYFLALAPLGFLVFHNRRWAWSESAERRMPWAMLVFSGVPLALSIFRTVTRYYF